MQNEGKPKDNHKAWREMRLAQMVGDGRQKRGLSRAIEDLSSDPVVTTHVPDENMAFLNVVNASLVTAGVSPPPPNWEQVLHEAKQQQDLLNEQSAERIRLLREAQREEEAQWVQELERIAMELGVEAKDISGDAAHCLQGLTGEDLKRTWSEKWWESPERDEDYYSMHEDDFDESDPEHLEHLRDAATAELDGLKHEVGPGLAALIETGETPWSLQRNAASAGFTGVKAYLAWRAGGTQ
jgi:hypothetical protein